MRWLSKLRRRVRLIVDRKGVEREMRDEMRFHLEMEAEELTRFGAAESEALRLARRRFGGVARFEDEARDARGGRGVGRPLAGAAAAGYSLCDARARARSRLRRRRHADARVRRGGEHGDLQRR